MEENQTPVEAVPEEGVTAAPETEARAPEEDAASRAAFARLLAAAERYPGLDWRREMGNPAFGRLLAMGLDPEDAYRLAHREEILGGAMAYAVNQTREKLAASLRAAAARPVENGLAPRTAPPQPPDPSKLTPQQRETLKDRVNRGEKVVF